jgi:hypothetical protein
MDGQHTSPSSTTTTTPISEQIAHPSYAHEQALAEMPSAQPPMPPPHMLGRPTDQAVSALAQAMQSGLARRLFHNVVSFSIPAQPSKKAYFLSVVNASLHPI